MPARKLMEYLDARKIPYEVLTHPKAFTSQGVAASMHVSGRDFAKAVILRTDAGRLIMLVVPGPRHVNLDLVKEVLGAKEVALAREDEFAPLFPGCEPGAEPPFGNLYDLPVYVDESLRRDPEIIFNAGTHVETIRMKYADFERAVHSVVAPLSRAA
jgi:Ala-tRNA(Pro) deacylase